MAGISEPELGVSAMTKMPQQEGYSAAAVDGHHRAAQATNVAGHHAEAHQGVSSKSKSKRIPDDNIAKIVAEENERRNKFPKYPGLERWELLEKMGDGAFSNVYRARDLEGKAGEVAIKVVRKFEMNNMQVRENFRGDTDTSLRPSTSFPSRCVCLRVFDFFSFRFYQRRDLSRAINISIQTLNQKPQRLQRCEKLFLLSYYFLEAREKRVFSNIANILNDNKVIGSSAHLLRPEIGFIIQSMQTRSC